MNIETAAAAAKNASFQCATLSSQTKNNAIARIIDALASDSKIIFEANKTDLENAARENLSQPLTKRLKFDQARLDETIAGLTSLSSLPDPVGKTLLATELDAGLELYKVSSPIGVLGVIFESRPDALVQIGSLCLKSGNSVLMKGGREAKNTNQVLAQILIRESVAAGFPENWMTLLETRADVDVMLGLDSYMDLVIPRGSNEFVRYIMEHTNIPVMGHADGICHLYIDARADLDMAEKICLDSKIQYVAVCNAAETLLVHQDIAADVLPRLEKALTEKNVEIRGCEITRKYIKAIKATEADWKTEYLDLIISIKVVPSLEAAITHINTFGSHHTDAIVTGNATSARRFMDAVDSANVFHNASTRFSDGYKYGLGAEVGISTGKLHARGPVGMEGLLSYKWKLLGSGQTVSEYSGANAKKFLHRPIGREFPKQK